MGHFDLDVLNMRNLIIALVSYRFFFHTRPSVERLRARVTHLELNARTSKFDLAVLDTNILISQSVIVLFSHHGQALNYFESYLLCCVNGVEGWS